MYEAYYYCYLAVSSLLLQLTFGQIPFASESDGCTFMPNEEKCYILAHCTNIISINNYDFLHIGNPLCDYHRFSVLDYGEQLPIHLKFKCSYVSSECSVRISVVNDDYLMRQTLTSLDLSENEYETIPEICQLPNLKSFNVSRNYLNSAKFDQDNIETLEEIDFSYNAISIIDTTSLQHSNNELKVINLSHNYLVDLPDSVFEYFTKLENLDLSHNFIDSISMFTFEGIKKLLRLNIGHNRISSLNSALFRFNNLQELNLSNNRLQVLKYSDFEKLNNLTILNLSFNVLKDIETNVFNSMSILKVLDLSDNQVVNLDKLTFAMTNHLEKVDLSSNQLVSFEKEMFKGKNVSDFSIKENGIKGSLDRGMFEGLKITYLDLSNQNLDSVEDLAFFGMDKLKVILLNNNVINKISRSAFNTLRFLEELDLSNNKIKSLDFDKTDLQSLRFLSLDGNEISKINPDSFQDLTSLNMLYLSSNKISQLESESFKDLKQLSNFQVSNNPLTGNLTENTFDGLNSLPSLDISCTLLTSVHNYSFHGMVELKTLNISHSRISEIHYNSLAYTGGIIVLDLSHNILTVFNVKTNELHNLEMLLINNNRLKNIFSFTGLSSLLHVSLAFNDIQTLAQDLFKDNRKLKYFDISFNPKLKFNVSCFESLDSLNSLFISGIKNNITFASIHDSSIINLKISHAELTNVTSLEIKKNKHLVKLVLDYNNISILENGSFNGLNSLTDLDVSFNKIIFIQPGIFVDNTVLYSLNISHNFLKTIAYGIFRGPINLSIVDISFNEITDFQSETFHEVKSLTELLADHNMIDTISAEDFHGTNLRKLSIGGNPIPCKVLVNLKKRPLSFNITALRLYENNYENNEGVTCNMGKYSTKVHLESGTVVAGQERDLVPILVQIRDLLQSQSKLQDENVPENKINLLKNISSDIQSQNDELTKIQKALLDANNAQLNKLENLPIDFAKISYGTDALLEKIIQILSSNKNKLIPPPTNIASNNNVSEIMQYVDRMKSYLENVIASEKQNIMHSLDKKFATKFDTSKIAADPTGVKVANNENTNSSSIFTETCVTLILLILIGFILYKFYKSRMFVRPNRTLSTRRIANATDNSDL